MKRMVNENLIKLLEDLSSKGITADDIEKAVNKKLYEYTINDSDIGFTILLSVDLGDVLFIPVDSTELIEEQKEILTKFYNCFNNGNYKYSAYTDDSNWIPFHITIERSDNILGFYFEAITENDTIYASYRFNVVNGLVDDIDEIIDTDFGDGINIKKNRKI